MDCFLHRNHTEAIKIRENFFGKNIKHESNLLIKSKPLIRDVNRLRISVKGKYITSLKDLKRFILMTMLRKKERLL